MCFGTWYILLLLLYFKLLNCVTVRILDEIVNVDECRD